MGCRRFYHGTNSLPLPTSRPLPGVFAVAVTKTAGSIFPPVALGRGYVTSSDQQNGAEVMVGQL